MLFFFGFITKFNDVCITKFSDVFINVLLLKFRKIFLKVINLALFSLEVEKRNSMKKVILTVMFLFCIQFGVKAQIMKIGIKAGVNYANFTSSKLQTDALTSYHAGLVANFRLSEKFSIQPEVMYSTQGASYKNVVDEVVDEVKAELGYVSVPVLARIGLGKSVTLDLGPQFSWLASKNVDFNTEVKELDFGAAGGLSLKLTDNIFLQGRYVLGLSEIGKNADIKNSVGQLSLGYMF